VSDELVKQRTRILEDLHRVALHDRHFLDHDPPDLVLNTRVDVLHLEFDVVIGGVQDRHLGVPILEFQLFLGDPRGRPVGLLDPEFSLSEF